MLQNTDCFKYVWTSQRYEIFFKNDENLQKFQPLQEIIDVTTQRLQGRV